MQIMRRWTLLTAGGDSLGRCSARISRVGRRSVCTCCASTAGCQHRSAIHTTRLPSRPSALQIHPAICLFSGERPCLRVRNIAFGTLAHLVSGQGGCENRNAVRTLVRAGCLTRRRDRLSQRRVPVAHPTSPRHLGRSRSRCAPGRRPISHRAAGGEAAEQRPCGAALSHCKAPKGGGRRGGGCLAY